MESVLAFSLEHFDEPEIAQEIDVPRTSFKYLLPWRRGLREPQMVGKLVHVAGPRVGEENSGADRRWCFWSRQGWAQGSAAHCGSWMCQLEAAQVPRRFSLRERQLFSAFFALISEIKKKCENHMKILKMLGQSSSWTSWRCEEVDLPKRFEYRGEVWFESWDPLTEEFYFWREHGSCASVEPSVAVIGLGFLLLQVLVAPFSDVIGVLPTGWTTGEVPQVQFIAAGGWKEVFMVFHQYRVQQRSGASWRCGDLRCFLPG